MYNHIEGKQKFMLFPQYRLPKTLIISLVVSFIFGRRRSFARDARLAIKGITPAPQYLGLDNIPKHGPFLLLVNHYSRPGFFVLWGALAVSACLPGEPVWMMTRAWTSPGSWWDKPKRFLTSAFFTRLARMYGFITMPPMPPEPQDATERALSIRRLIQAARANPECIIALAPEGRDIPGGGLGEPPPGSGRLIAELFCILHHAIPVGIYEREGMLRVRFGKELHLLPMINENSSKSIDQAVNSIVMTAISKLLPDEILQDYK